MPIRMTQSGQAHKPSATHHFAAWGGIKELLRLNNGSATREEIERVLAYCWHEDRKYQPNTAYLDYALKKMDGSQSIEFEHTRYWIGQDITRFSGPRARLVEAGWVIGLKELRRYG